MDSIVPMTRKTRKVVAAFGGALLSLALVACSTVRPWINQPRVDVPEIDVRAVAQRDASSLFAVSLSGGGAWPRHSELEQEHHRFHG